MIGDLLSSRQILNTQTIESDENFVRALDIDPTESFLLFAGSSGCCHFTTITDPNYGTLDDTSHVFLNGTRQINRVQWSPDIREPCAYMLTRQTLTILDGLQKVEQFHFRNEALWSDWNTIDQKMIAVACNNSNVTLIDVASGNALQTIVVPNSSMLKTHIATRCAWSKHDSYCLIVGDNDGYLHIFDTRHSVHSLMTAGVELGEINCLSFTNDQNSIITTHGPRNRIVQWKFNSSSLKPCIDKFADKPVEESDPHGNDQLPSSGRSSRAVRSRSRRQLSSSFPLSIAPKFFRGSQFYLTDRFLFCPANDSNRQQLEASDLNVYDLLNGNKVTSIKTESASRGVHCVAGLLPKSMVLYTGGARGLRIWTIDEDFGRRKKQEYERYHQTRWESDDDSESDYNSSI